MEVCKSLHPKFEMKSWDGSCGLLKTIWYGNLHQQPTAMPVPTELKDFATYRTNSHPNDNMA
eukprot:scaffold771_cov177-Alexandrium_tamarense.AAC.10